MVGFGDNIGSGFTKIMNAWKELGYPSPTIRQEDEVDEVWLTLPFPPGFPIFITSYDGVNSTNGIINGTDGTVNNTNDTVDGTDGTANDTVNDTVNSEDDTVKNPQVPLSPTQSSVLSVLSANPEMTAEKVCDILNISRRTVMRAYKALQEEGYLIRIGSDKSGRWIVNMYNKEN